MARTTIIVVGAGMAGASIAAMLAADAEVTLLEMEGSAGYHTTGRSAAIYLPDYGNATIRALTRASRDFLASPPPGFADHPLLGERGLLILADAGHEAALDSPPYDRLPRLTVEEARALIPPLRPDAFVAARHDSSAADIDVDLLHRGYLKLARARGARIMLGQGVLSATRADGRWFLTTSGGEGMAADVIVNAAGAWGDILAERCGVRPIGLSPRRRTMVLIDPPQDLATEHWPFAVTVEESVYFKPDAGKLAISPADETEAEPGDAQPEELDVAIAIDRFETLMDVPVRRVTHSWAGLRTFAPDRTPVIGYDPGAAGFFWFVGQGGYGIQTAPAAAELGAALVSGGAIPEAILAQGVVEELLAPGRFRKTVLA